MAQVGGDRDQLDFEDEEAAQQEAARFSVTLDKLASKVDGKQFTEHVECCICLQEFQEGEEVTPLPCDEERHYFHTECLKQWARIKHFCPLCNKTFTKEQLDEFASKRETLKEKPEGGHKKRHSVQIDADERLLP